VRDRRTALSVRTGAGMAGNLEWCGSPANDPLGGH
jgi:hypothetical protein